MDPRINRSAWRGHEYFADWLVKEIDPKITVEIGTHRGFSAWALAKSNNGKVYTIDINDFKAQDVLDELLGKDKVKCIIGESSEISETWTEGSIDILHIDGDHSERGVTTDLTMWSRYLSLNGVILMHDVLNPMFYSAFSAFNKMHLSTLSTGYMIETHKRVLLGSQGLGIVTIDGLLVEKIDSTFGPNNVITSTALIEIHNFVLKAMELSK